MHEVHHASIHLVSNSRTNVFLAILHFYLEIGRNVYLTIDPWIISDWAPNFGPAEWWNRKTKNELRLYYKKGHLTKIEHFYWGFDTGNLH